MLYRMNLTCYETTERLDAICIGATTTGFALLPGIFEIGDFNLIKESFLLNHVKLIVTIDDIKLRSNLITNKTKVNQWTFILQKTKLYQIIQLNILKMNLKEPPKFQILQLTIYTMK